MNGNYEEICTAEAAIFVNWVVKLIATFTKEQTTNRCRQYVAGSRGILPSAISDAILNDDGKHLSKSFDICEEDSWDLLLIASL